jgi:hypothetical protein
MVELQFRTLLNGNTYGTGTFSYNGQFAPVTILHQGDLTAFTYEDPIVGKLNLSNLANFDFVYQSVDNICSFNIIVASPDRLRSLTAGPSQPHRLGPGTSANTGKPQSQGVQLEWPRMVASPPTPPPVPSSGEFDVPLTSLEGIEFVNKFGKKGVFTFSASGSWKADPKWDWYCTPPGVPNSPYQKYMKYPNNTTFALLAVNKQTDKVLAEVGSEATLTLEPGQILSFKVNDLPACYGDNTGKITIRWSFKPI